MLCELFFRSCSFPTRVRAQVHVRSGLDALLIAPFFFSGPFPPISGPFGGGRFALCQDSLQFVTARALEKGAQFTFVTAPVPFPLPLPCASLVPCQAAMFQVPRKSGLSPSCTVRRPQVTPASCLCRQAYGPCLISSFRLAPFAFESSVPAQHGLTTALGSAQFLLWSPCRPLTAMNSALADYLSSEEETGPLGETITGGSILLLTGVGLRGRRPGLPHLLRFKRRRPG